MQARATAIAASLQVARVRVVGFMVGFSKRVAQRQADTEVVSPKGRRTDFFALKSLTAQRSNESSRAALAPGTVRPKEMHRVARPERAPPDWPNGRVRDIRACEYRTKY